MTIEDIEITIDKYYKNHHTDEYYTKYTKDEIGQMIDIYNPLTYLPFLEILDVPWIMNEWKKLCNRYGNKENSGRAVFGRYQSKMKLMSFKNFTYADTNKLNR